MRMNTEKPIKLQRDCDAVMVPSGEHASLLAGSIVWLTQALGGTYTVMTERGYSVRIDGQDGDTLGFAPGAEENWPQAREEIPAGSIDELVWNELRSCFDPEIPVNIVDLGLIYDCAAQPLPEGGYKAIVRFTLTAQGCGMGQFLKADIKKKLLAVPGVREADVELVWDPPWNQSMISAHAKQQLGIV
jgi:probable FeS assembly SUF system protein SufT